MSKRFFHFNKDGMGLAVDLGDQEIIAYFLQVSFSHTWQMTDLLHVDRGY